MTKARQSKLFTFYSQQSEDLLKSIRAMEAIDTHRNTSQSDYNLLFLGPDTSSKSLLVRSLCKTVSQLKNTKTETVQTQGLILTKTELSKAKTYKISNVKEYRERRGVNLLEFHEKISLSSLNCFSKLFSLIEETSSALCGCHKTNKAQSSLPIHSIILVIDMGSRLSTEELECLRHILDDIKEREIQPLLALCSNSTQNANMTEEDLLETIEREMGKAEELFSIPRENIFAMELTEGELTPENSYYLLRLLETSLRRASEVASHKSLQAKSSTWWELISCWS